MSLSSAPSRRLPGALSTGADDRSGVSAPSPFLDAGDPRIVGHDAARRRGGAPPLPPAGPAAADAGGVGGWTASDAWIGLPETQRMEESGRVGEPAAPPDAMAAALARLRARRAADVATSRVPATVATDDGVVEHVADVASWLATATERELRLLAADAWGGSEGVELARALAGDDPEIAEVVRHARRSDSELVVEVDARAAAAWLRAHRPEVADRLDGLLGEEGDEAGEDDADGPDDRAE